MPDTVTTAAPFPSEVPFLVEHRRAAEAGGSFVPSARLVLTPGLRTSGLWAALPPEELRDLILLLTFLTPNAWVRPALPELADAMRASHARARDRLTRLACRQWRGGPVVVALPSPHGLDAYAPGRHLLAHEEVPPPEDRGRPLPFPTAGREAVLAYSRARYARTRQEVEAEIAQRMGWAPPAFDGDTPEVADRKRAAYMAMTDLGMAKEQALDLLARFDVGRVERQVAWIGQRAAKSPSRFLAAAVEGDYEAPHVVRMRQALAGGAEPDGLPRQGADSEAPSAGEEANRTDGD